MDQQTTDQLDGSPQMKQIEFLTGSLTQLLS